MEKNEKELEEFGFHGNETEDSGDLEKELKDSLKTVWIGGYSKKSVLLYVRIQKRSKEQMRANMEQQVEDLLKEKNRVSQEAEFLHQQIRGTEKELQEKEKRLSEAREDLDRMEKKADMAAHDNQGQDETVRKLREENENYKQTEDFLRSELKARDGLFRQKEEAEEKIRELEALLAEKEAQINAAVSQQAETLSGQAREAGDKEALPDKKQGALYEEALTEKEEELGRLKNQLAAVRENLETQENKIRQMEIEKNMLGQEKEILHKQLFDLTGKQEEQNRLRQEYASLYHQMEELEQEKEESERKLAVYSERADKMKAQEAENMRKQQELKNDYLDIQDKFDQLYQQSNGLRSQIKHMEQERKAMEEVLEKYQKQEKDFVLLKNSNQSYVAEISEMEKSVRFIFDQMNEQMQEFSKLSRKYEEGKAQIQNLIREKTQMQLKNVELTEMLGKADSRDYASAKAGKPKYESTEEASEAVLEAAASGDFDFGRNADLPEKNLFTIADMKQRSLNMTEEIKERQKKISGGDGGAV